jgi:hypothetical protein
VRRWLAAYGIKPWQHRSWIFPRDPDFAAKAARVHDLYNDRNRPFCDLVAHVMTREPYVSARRVFWVVDNGSSHAGQASIQRMQQTRRTDELVHLPTHASWLNQIEIYFSIVQRKGHQAPPTSPTSTRSSGGCSPSRLATTPPRARSTAATTRPTSTPTSSGWQLTNTDHCRGLTREEETNVDDSLVSIGPASVLPLFNTSAEPVHDESDGVRKRQPTEDASPLVAAVACVRSMV